MAVFLFREADKNEDTVCCVLLDILYTYIVHTILCISNGQVTKAQRIVTTQFLWSNVVVFVFFTATSFATKMDALSIQCWLFDAAISHLQCNKTFIRAAKGAKRAKCSSEPLICNFLSGKMLGCTGHQPESDRCLFCK